MKFLVFALCVCAASAASFGSFPGSNAYKGFQNTVAAPAVYAGKAVASAVVAPAAVAASATYNAGSAVYQGAKQVVNKAYSSDGEAAVLRSDSDVTADGYRYAYETANGISGEATGVYKTVGDSGSVVSQGSYRYTAPDGTPVVVTYVADENGFQPQSDVIPVAPEIPAAIQRSLEYIAAKSRETVQKY